MEKKKKKKRVRNGLWEQRGILHQAEGKYIRPRELEIAMANIYSDMVLC